MFHTKMEQQLKWM